MQITENEVNGFAATGLRTLYLATKELDEDVFADWNQKFMEAKNMIIDRDQHVHDVCELIETDLELVGSTAIEDKLQDEVADTI